MVKTTQRKSKCIVTLRESLIFLPNKIQYMYHEKNRDNSNKLYINVNTRQMFISMNDMINESDFDATVCLIFCLRQQVFSHSGTAS